MKYQHANEISLNNRKLAELYPLFAFYQSVNQSTQHLTS